jgi:hypothetical protein
MSWQKDEEVTITFESLKNAQNEAFQQGIAFAISKLRKNGQEDLATELEIKISGAILYTTGDEK